MNLLAALRSKTTSNPATPMPRQFLEWQVALRLHTMQERAGAPHAGVAPLVTVRRPGPGLGVTTHSIICGLLPSPALLETKTDEFRRLYEETIPRGARATYDRGIEYLQDYYREPSDFDPWSITTLLPETGPLTDALRAEPRSTLLFYVFDLADKTDVGRFRCQQMDCHAEIHRDGPVYDNVWWHNTLFHGAVEDHVVVRFLHQRTLDTKFGRLEEVE